MLNRIRRIGANAPPKANSSGFICPMCKAVFDDAAGLTIHFDEKHGDHSNQSSPSPTKKLQPPPKNNSGTNGEVIPGNENLNAGNADSAAPMNDMLVQKELKKLEKELDAERITTESLKSEVSELIKYRSLGQDAEMLQQQLTMAIDTNETLVREKETIEQKAAKLSQNMVKIKQTYDEMESIKEDLKQKNENLSVELEKAATWIRDLESQLIQRPGADDVMVLKKELVTVQTMMDKITLESEKEKEEIRSKNRALSEELDKVKKLSAEANEKSLLLNTENENIKIKLKTLVQDTEGAVNEVTEKLNKEISWLQEDMKNVKTNLQIEQEHSKSAAEKNTSLEKDISDVRLQLQNNKDMNNGIKENLTNLQQVNLSLNDKVVGLEKEKETAILDLEKKVERKSEELRSFQNTVNEQRTRAESLNLTFEELSEQQKTTEMCLSESKSKYAELQLKFATVKTSKDEVQKKAEMDLQMHTAALRKFQVKVESLEGMNEQMQSVNDKLNEDLKNFHTSATDDKNSIQKELLNKEKQCLKWELEFQQLNQTCKKSKSELEIIQERFRSKEMEFDNVGENLRKLELEKSNTSNEMERLIAKVETMQLKYEQEIIKKDALADEVRKLQEERLSLMENIEAGEGQSSIVDQLKTENETVHGREKLLTKKLEDIVDQHEKTLASTNAEIQTQKSSLVSAQQNIDLLDLNNKKLAAELLSMQDKCNELSESCDDKSNRINDVIQENSQITSDMENQINLLQQNLHEKKAECEKLDSSLKEVREKGEDTKKQFENTRKSQHDENVELQKKLAAVEVVLSQANAEVENANEKLAFEIQDKENIKNQHQVSLDRIKQSHREKVTSLQSDVSECKHENSDLQEKLSKLSEHLTLTVKQQENVNKDLQSLYDEKVCAYNTLLTEVAQLKAASEESRKLHEETLKALNDDLDKIKLEKINLIKSSSEEMNKKQSYFDEKFEIIEQHNSKIADLETENELLKSQLNEKNLELDNAGTYSEKQEQEMIVLKLNLETIKEDLKDSTLQNQNVVADLKSKMSDQTKHIELYETNVAKLNTETTTLRTNNEALLVAEQQLKEELSDANNLLVETEKHLEVAHEELDTKSAALVDGENKINDFSTDMEELKNKLVTIQAEKDDVDKLLEAEKENLKAQLEKAAQKKAENLEKTLEYEKEHSLLCEKVSNMEIIIQELKQKFNEEHEQKLANEKLSTDEKQTILCDFKKKEEDWNVEKEELLQSQMTLKNAQQILINSKTEIQHKVNELVNEASRKDDILSQLQAKVSIQQETEREKEENLKRLSEVLETNKSLLSEKQDIEIALRGELQTLRDNLDAVRSEWQASIQQVDVFKAESDQLKGQVNVLETTIHNNSDERRALLERCLRSEQQLEEMQKQEIQMKRKLEDAHAAMHELGRENQALQVKHTSVLTRQWADDREAVECRGCQMLFSLTVRKHHCRHCGNIYCSDCSAKTATVASSKKPVRVCDKCFDDLFTTGVV